MSILGKQQAAKKSIAEMQDVLRRIKTDEIQIMRLNQNTILVSFIGGGKVLLTQGFVLEIGSTISYEGLDMSLSTVAKVSDFEID
jgi:hypothetical protein